jgi:radical SAM superfamily enzyme
MLTGGVNPKTSQVHTCLSLPKEGLDGELELISIEHLMMFQVILLLLMKLVKRTTYIRPWTKDSFMVLLIQ